MGTFYVYVDYTTEQTPRPFYVGKGSWLRVSKRRRSVLHDRISKKYGHERYIELTTDDEEAAFQCEKRLIEEYKTFVHGGAGWWGANMTLGGEGPSGAKLPKSAATKAKMSKASKGRKMSDEARAKMRAAWVERKKRGTSPETRQRMRDSAKTRPPVTSETRERLSKANKGKKKFSKELSARLAVLRRRENLSPETLKRMSDSQNRRRERERKAKQQSDS